MDVADLLRRVQAYGLDEVEANLYYNLSRLGPSRAATLADAAGRKRTDVYRVLDHLVEKGFAEKTLERPAVYVPRPLEEALAHALGARRRQTEDLEALRGELAQAWPRPVSEATATRSRFTVHQGTTQAMGLLLRLVAAAKEEIVLAVSADGLARLDAEALRRALRARAEAGVLVRVLAKRARGGDAPFGGLDGVRVRYADTPTFYQMLAIDDREIALFVAAGKGISDAGEETVLWLSSPDVVLAQKALFDQVWMLGLTGAELAQPRSRQLQVLRGRWVRTARLREMVASAQASLDITAPPAETAQWGARGLLASLAEAAARGVHVVVRGDPGLRVPGVRNAGAGGDGRNLVAVVDGVESLVSFGLGGDVAGEDEWALWSTHPDLVALLGMGGVVMASAAPVVRRRPTHDP